jgi:hypothetical protein
VNNHPPTATEPADDLAGSIAETLHDLSELAAVMPGSDEGQRRGNAVIADRLAEECAEAAAMIRSLPGRPAAMSGHDRQMLAALRRAHDEGEDVAETIARALARLAADLGSAAVVVGNRPGSWEAALITRLLAGTVGETDDDPGRYQGPGGAGGSL